MISGTVISIIVMVLAQVLPSLGVNLGSTELTTVVADLITVIAAVVAWVRHVSVKKQALGAGNVNAFGGTKKQ